MDRLDIAVSFVFIVVGILIYSPLSFLYSIDILDIISFISLICLIVSGILIFKRKKRAFTLSTIVFLLLFSYGSIQSLIHEKISPIILVSNALIFIFIIFLILCSVYLVLKERFIEGAKKLGKPVAIIIYIVIGIIIFYLKHSLTAYLNFFSKIPKIELIPILMLIIVFILLLLSAVFIYDEKHFAFNIFSLMFSNFYFIFSIFYWNYWKEFLQLLYLLIPLLLLIVASGMYIKRLNKRDKSRF